MVGIDLIKVDRIRSVISKEGKTKIFTKNEINYADKKSEIIKESDNCSEREYSYAGCFAATEAFLKAIGIGIGGHISLLDIEINHNELGAPCIVVNTKIKNELERLRKHSIFLSISHDGGNAIAIVIIE